MHGPDNYCAKCHNRSTWQHVRLQLLGSFMQNAVLMAALLNLVTRNRMLDQVTSTGTVRLLLIWQQKTGCLVYWVNSLVFKKQERIMNTER